jgi:DnaK suppressor protein
MKTTQPGVGSLAPQDLKEAEAALLDQRDRLRSEIATAEEAESAVRDDCDLDAADTGAKNVTIQELRTRTDDAAALLERTLAALTRVQDGTLGICANCGAAVGRERIMAMPHAELCVTCTWRAETASTR